MVNQIEFDPSRLSHLTLPARRAKSAEKFRASPPVAPRPGKFETPLRPLGRQAPEGPAATTQARAGGPGPPGSELPEFLAGTGQNPAPKGGKMAKNGHFGHFTPFWGRILAQLGQNFGISDPEGAGGPEDGNVVVRRPSGP